MAYQPSKDTLVAEDAVKDQIAVRAKAEALASNAAAALLDRASKKSAGAPLPELVYAHYLKETGVWSKTLRSTDGRVFHWNSVFWEEVDEEQCGDAAQSWLEEF